MGDDEALFEGTESEIAAATKLQAIQRGRAARADVRKLRDDRDAASRVAIGTASAVAEAKTEAEAASQAERAALEDNFVGTDDEQAAATKLQAITRGRLARAKVAQLKAEHLNAAATMASAEAAIAFAGTSDEHVVATRVDAIQRGRVARVQLVAEKAHAAAKLADVDAQIARVAEGETDNSKDVDALESKRFDAAEALDAVATKLQAMRRATSAKEYVEKLRETKLANEVRALEIATTKEDADHETRVALEAESELHARLPPTGDETQQTLVTKLTALRRVFAAQARSASLWAEQLAAEARAADAEADAVDAKSPEEDVSDDEENQQTGGDTPGGVETEAEAENENENEHTPDEPDETPWMSEEEKAAFAERASATARVRAKTAHVKCAFEFAEATATLARIDASYFVEAAAAAERTSNESSMSVVEKITALSAARDAREALETSQTAALEASIGESVAREVDAQGDTEIGDGTESDENAKREVDVETEKGDAAATTTPSGDVDEGDDKEDDKEDDVMLDRFEALRAVCLAQHALHLAPDPDAPTPKKEYKPTEMHRAPAAGELPRDAVAMHHSFGFESVKRNNLHYLSTNVVVFTVGAIVQTLNLLTLEQTYIHGIDGEGIGFVAVHPDKTHFALGEKGVNPNVFVYETNTLTLVKVLVGGTERAYSCGRFSRDGTKLATVGAWPDFWLTVWDWRTEAIVLRSKAFSQEVFDVTFSPFFDGQLTTSGTGHVRFWKMAETFTGLKLMGDIGRFGTENLSDIAGYAEMPDGKVLTGTESGRLLMWDGGLIRAVLLRPGGAPCHLGQIEFITLVAETGKVYTAGADGYVRVWSYQQLNDAEPGEDSVEAFVEPVREFLLTRGETRKLTTPSGRTGTPKVSETETTSTYDSASSARAASIKSLIMSEPDHWLVQDEFGGIIYVPVSDAGVPDVQASTRVVDFHAGAINALEASQQSDVCITAGDDGTVRVFDYVHKTETCARRFAGSATALQLAPTNVDESGRAAVVGFGDGVVRVLLLCRDGWKLTCVVKPHNGTVTCVQYAPKAPHPGNPPYLATAGQDGKVWFFAVAREKGAGLAPVGFFAAPGPVSAVCWNDTGDSVLVGCETGQVFQCDAPKVGSVDCTRSYAFQPTLTHYVFKRPRASAAVVLAEREGAPPEISGVDMDPADVIEAKALRKRFDDRALELQVEMDERERVAVYPVRHLGYDTSGSFELTVGGDAAGIIFHCSFAQQTPVSWSECHPKAVVTTFKSQCGVSKRLNVSGAANGTVRVSRAGVEKHWLWEVHDAHRGAVTGACISRCEKFLLTAAKDGSFFAQILGDELRGVCQPGVQTTVESLTVDGAVDSVNVDGAVESASKLTEDVFDDPVPLTADDATNEVEDLVSSTTFSIEDAKIKVEEDAKRSASEEEKMGVREFLEKLKAEYKALRVENELKPENERLPNSAFEVDPGLRDVVELETLAELRKTKDSMAWHCEKSALGLAKLNRWFLDDVEQERVVLRSFHAGRQAFAVTSFRVLKPAPELAGDLAASRSARARDTQTQRGAGSGHRERTSGSGGSVRLSRSANLKSGGSLGGHVSATEQDNPFAAGHKQEERRKKRLRREAEWRAFNTTKPDALYENPEDVAAIDVATRTLGNYHLKSEPSPELVSDEADEVNYGKKRDTMLRLESSTRQARVDFNASFFQLRHTREKVILETVRNAARVEEITAVLDDAHTPEGAEALNTINNPWRTTPLADEYPTETRGKVTESALSAFAKARAAAVAAAKKKEAAKAGGGFGGGGDDVSGDDLAKDATDEPVPIVTSGVDETPGVNTVAKVKNAIGADAEAGALPDPSDDEKTTVAFTALRLRHERSVLVRHRVDLTNRFDKKLLMLRREKSFVEGELKTAESRQLKYNRELVSLKRFEDGERELTEKLAVEYSARETISVKCQEIEDAMENLTVELDVVDERKSKVLVMFNKLVDDTHGKRAYLTKIFTRRIKRLKKEKDETELRDEDDTNSESDSSDDDDDDDDEYNSDDEMEESRPEECDEFLWAQILALRERRQDADDATHALSKQVEDLRKESAGLAKTGKGVGKTLAALQAQMAAFQREKQETMNAIEMTVPLRLKQVEYLRDGRLPTVLRESVVFSKSVLRGLGLRIESLISEKANLRKTQRDLRQEHSVLKQATVDLSKNNAELEQQATNMTMLRFGKRIDLDAMERVMLPKKGIEELKVLLKQVDTQNRDELQRWQGNLRKAQTALTKTTAKNTEVLTAVANLTHKKRELETALRNTQSSVFVDPDAARREEARERDKLVAVVNAQASEIDTLRQEIGFLSVKGQPGKPMFER